MPTNLYCPNDNYDLANCHVLSELRRKMYEAKEKNAKEIIVWRTDAPRRKFLDWDDMADACIFLINLKDEL